MILPPRPDLKQSGHTRRVLIELIEDYEDTHISYPVLWSMIENDRIHGASISIQRRMLVGAALACMFATAARLEAFDEGRWFGRREEADAHAHLWGFAEGDPISGR